MCDETKKELSRKDEKELYENGKTRRYNLLFAANGGAFALAKLMVGGDTANKITQPNDVVLGGLTLSTLAVGMVLFTLVMTADLFVFGYYSKSEDWYKPPFGFVGMLVLMSIGLLISLGWLTVSGFYSLWSVISIVLFFLIIYLKGYYSFKGKNNKS